VFFFDGNVVDANSGYTFTASDKFALIGGELQIGETQAQGAVKGCIRFEPTGNKLQYSHNCSAYADMGSGDGLWTDNTTYATRENFHILDTGLAAGSTTAGLDGNGTYAFYD